MTCGLLVINRRVIARVVETEGDFTDAEVAITSLTPYELGEI